MEMANGDKCSYQTYKALVDWLPSTNRHTAFHRRDALPVQQCQSVDSWLYSLSLSVLTAIFHVNLG